LCWLYHRVLQHAFERDDQVLQSAGAFIRTMLRTLWQSATSADSKAPTARLILLLIEMLPRELQEVVQTDEVLLRELSIRPTRIVRVGELQFAKTAYLKAARGAVAGKQAKARMWRSREEVTFDLAPGGIMVKRPTGEQLHVTDPLLGLLSERPEDRIYRSLFQISAHLAWSVTEVSDQPAEFARILEKVMGAYPSIMWVYRPLLLRIWPCEAAQARLHWPLVVKSRSGVDPIFETAS
jgi:hypothetical protein